MVDFQLGPVFLIRDLYCIVFITNLASTKRLLPTMNAITSTNARWGAVQRAYAGFPAFPARGRRAGGLPCVNRRDMMVGVTGSALSGAVGSVKEGNETSIPTPIPTPPLELDSNGVERLKLLPQGWNVWKWNGHSINWTVAGTPGTGPPVLLIHGFGASVYHWRYVMPALAKAGYQVFAMDCLGFGWSDKALVDYGDYSVWTHQIAEFTRQVIFKDASAHRSVVLVGNSLGGYNSLATAASYPDLVKGVVLLNSAGRFDEPGGETAPAADAAAAAADGAWLRRMMDQAGSVFRAGIIRASFIVAKQPARIRQVLGQVYVSPQNLDDDLVQSILLPAQDPNAAEVFCRVITAKGTPVNVLLDRLMPEKMPIFLLWGARDPWCVPARADQIQAYYPQATRTDIESGHCPHDDTPQLVVPELVKWMNSL